VAISGVEAVILVGLWLAVLIKLRRRLRQLRSRFPDD